MPAPLLYESHCHTTLCKHAIGHPDAYAETALARGLRGITFTCHCPLPDGLSSHVRMAPEEFATYVTMIEATKARFADVLDVRIGLESDYFPGVEPWLAELHQRIPLSHVLGSIHYQLADYRAEFDPGDPLTYQEVYFDHLAMSAESGLFDTLSHPDLIKNDSPDHWDFDRLRPVVARALDRIAATGTAMELNTSGVLKVVPEMNPSPTMLAMMRDRKIPVVIGSDAHRPDRVGDGYPQALRALKSVGYEDVSYFIDRQRQSVKIDEALASLTSL